MSKKLVTARRIIISLPVILLVNLVLVYHLADPHARVEFLRGSPRPLFCHNVAVASASRLAELPRPVRPKMNPAAPRASVIRPQELLEKASSSFIAERGVSKIIHQSWKNHDVPKLLSHLVDSWRLTYPDYQYVLWTDADNRQLVAQRYPELMPIYTALPSEIYRADFTRNLYMHAFGGIYADLDSEAITSLVPTFHTHSTLKANSIAFLGEMKTENFQNHSIPNAFMASSPGHPFWFTPLEFASSVLRRGQFVQIEREEAGPEWITGPVALKESYLKYTAAKRHLAKEAPVVLLESPKIYPFSWDDSDDLAYCVCSSETRYFDTELCKLLRPGGSVISYWSHSWGGWAFGKWVLEWTPWALPTEPQTF